MNNNLRRLHLSLLETLEVYRTLPQCRSRLHSIHQGPFSLLHIRWACCESRELLRSSLANMKAVRLLHCQIYGGLIWCHLQMTSYQVVN